MPTLLETPMRYILVNFTRTVRFTHAFAPEARWGLWKAFPLLTAPIRATAEFPNAAFGSSLLRRPFSGAFTAALPPELEMTDAQKYWLKPANDNRA